MLSWSLGAVKCRVVASAGAYVLLKLDTSRPGSPAGRAALTYLDGMTPMGWDGDVQAGVQDGEVRFHLQGSPDRRSSVRVPMGAEIVAAQGDRTEVGRVLDVSAGGVRFRHPGAFARDSQVHLRFKLPGGPLVESDAVVRATEDGLSSTEFAGLPGATTAEIGSWTVSQLRAALSGSG